MTTYPTITNGGLIVFVLAAAILTAAVYADNFCTQNNPGAIIRQDIRTGAITTTSTTKEVVMSDSTEALAAILSAVSDLRPWWVCPTSSEPYRGFAEKVRDFTPHLPGEPARWVTWQSAPLGDGTLDCWLRRMVDLDEELHVMEVRDDILLDCDDTRTEIPVGLADDAVSLIRAVVDIHAAQLKPFEDPGWMGPDGVTYPSKDDYYRAQEAPMQLNADGTMPLTPNRLDDVPEAAFFETMAEARQYVVTALGDWGDDFDVDEITRMVFDFDTAEGADGIEHLNRQGLRLIATSEEFWDVVRDNELHPRD